VQSRGAERRPHGGCSSSQEAEGALLCATATGPEGTAWSCVRAGAAGGQGKGLHQRAVGMEWAAQGSGHSPELLELKERLDSVLKHRVWLVLCRARSWTPMILVCPFQLEMFYAFSTERGCT